MTIIHLRRVFSVSHWGSLQEISTTMAPMFILVVSNQLKTFASFLILKYSPLEYCCQGFHLTLILRLFVQELHFAGLFSKKRKWYFPALKISWPVFGDGSGIGYCSWFGQPRPFWRRKTSFCGKGNQFQPLHFFGDSRHTSNFIFDSICFEGVSRPALFDLDNEMLDQPCHHTFCPGWPFCSFLIIYLSNVMAFSPIY